MKRRNYTLLLASASPRRQEMLESLGIPYRTSIPNIPEEWSHTESSISAALRLAEAKAAAVPASENELVVAMDTIVAVGRHKLGKPGNDDEAESMLRLLSGKEHRVITGIALRHGKRKVVASETTRVLFRPLQKQEILWYIRTGEPFDKAGGYAIQGLARIFVTSIHGCYFNIVGFPVSRFLESLNALGFTIYDFMKESI